METNKNDLESMIRQSYSMIEDKEITNTVVQGLSGFFGGMTTWIADVGVIAVIYAPMISKIRIIYGRKPIPESVLPDMLKNIGKEILYDILFDKILGNIPLIGIYFNAICARNLTWRLGILFCMLSVRGEDIDSSSITDSVKVIRKNFPQKSMFGFNKPKYDDFKNLVLKFHELTLLEYKQELCSDLDKNKIEIPEI